MLQLLLLLTMEESLSCAENIGSKRKLGAQGRYRDLMKRYRIEGKAYTSRSGQQVPARVPKTQVKFSHCFIA